MVFESVSPNTGQAFATWSPASPTAIEGAATSLAQSAAVLAHDMPARQDRLARAIEAVRSAGPALAAMTVREVGKTPEEAAAEVGYAISFLEYAARLVREHPFETSLSADRRVRQAPLGLSLLITPYNDPIAGLTRKIGPALAAGAGAIVKPSELGVQTATIMAAAFEAAGLSEVVRFLPIADHAVIGALIDRPEIGVVSFTGSTEAGRSVAMRCAQTLTPFIAELGGVNPFVVLRDADLGAAIRDLTLRKTKAAGQACSAQNVVFAERPIAAALSEGLVGAFAAIRAAPSDAPGAAMGPVRTASALARFRDLCAKLERQGGRRLVGGPASDAGGAYIAPPTAYEAPLGSVLEAEEAFAPLCAVAAFEDRGALQARLMRNAKPLALYVYGADLEAIEGFAAPLRYGSIGINTTAIQSPEAPTGGFRDAGHGREGGPWGLSGFLAPINIRRSAP